MGLSSVPWAVALGLAAISQASVPSVNVDMKAAFPAGPFLLELLETAAGENATAYFPLLDRIAQGHFASSTSDADLYAKFRDVLRDDGHIATSESLSTFDLALSLRSAAPRIEAHYQYYSTAVETTGEAPTSDCDNWVLLDGERFCTPAMDRPRPGGSISSDVLDLPFDRTIGDGRQAVLYADPASKAFGAFHNRLHAAAQAGGLKYRVRYRRNAHTISTSLPVSGYGVELAVKRTDYIVIDDREASPNSDQAPLSSKITLDDDEDMADLKPLSTSELSSLGMKTSSFILQSDNPLESLVKLTQDFQKYSGFISAQNVSEEFVQGYEGNIAQMGRGGANILWVNGLQLIERQIEPFALVEMLRRERKIINGVRDLGLDGKQAVSLLGHDKISSAQSDDEPPRYDWTDRTEDGRVILWLNDLEKDERYNDYPKSLSSLLRTYPGQMPHIARNIFTLVVPVDFTNAEDLAFVAQIDSLIQRGIPVQFGLAPLVQSTDAAAQAQIVYYLVENFGPDAAVAYSQGFQDDSKIVANEALFLKTLEGLELLPEGEKKSFSDVLASDSYKEQVAFAEKWAKRLNAGTAVRPAFADGLVIPRDQNWLQELSKRISEDLQAVQKGVYHGLITEETWVPGVFLEDAAPNRNIHIAVDDDKALRILDVNRIHTEHAALFNNIPLLQAYAESTKENWAVLTVLADVDTADGQSLVLSALAFKRNNPGVQLDIVHNHKSATGGSPLNEALKLNQDKLGSIENADELKDLVKQAIGRADDGIYDVALAAFLATLKVLPGEQLIILNGRVVGPFTSAAPFREEDFQQLLEFEQKTRILPVFAAIDDLNLTSVLSGPLAAAKLTSVIALSTISDLPEGIFGSTSSARTTIYDSFDSSQTAIEVGDAQTANIHIVAVLNPVSEQCQRWAPILKVLSELDGVYVKLILSPKDKIDELPIKRFFRYVLSSKPSFDKDGKVEGLKATFKGLPSEVLLTAGMNVPPSWLVAPKVSVHDLDNIKLSSVKSDVDATYELEHILIEGHSREGSKSTPPRGAQLVLGTQANPLVTDTIVMANLGFFQFKANPGVYNIRLKEGRTAEIYRIESIGAQGWEPVAGDEGTQLALMDFQGTTLYPRLKRRAGMEQVDVLEDSKASEGIVAKGFKFAEGLFGGSNTKSVSAKEHAEINIFSVASGHLYERMLNIMMVSVMRHTKHTVKFWFIEQFLSPSFKDFIPHLAEAYGFKYEMVTYKWPHWLRQQKEKQREIWGYKILFLDVLFPLSLDKVIFVDADQIVRTDMIDLVNHDLDGAPYGFTPMCDSRTEMEGFRFWKQGYWAGYLRGLPYHISALYVVDLGRFRELAAGDRLRQQYHSLSADPNSLSNLDQDLPNHMQFQIPIHSLPQEWLWCETWCSDESQSQARTIDLCNNPQTKEPKLDRARRQVPEWTEYDDEIAELDKRRRGNSGTGSGSDADEAVPDKSAATSEESDGGTNTKSRRFEETGGHVVDEL